MGYSYTDSLNFGKPDKGEYNWAYDFYRNLSLIDVINSQDNSDNFCVSGCAISIASGATVDLTAGVVSVDGTELPVSSGNVSLTVASTEREQYNIIYIDSAGALKVYPSDAFPTDEFALIGLADCDATQSVRVASLRRFFADERTPLENNFQNGTLDVWQRYAGSATAVSAATEEFFADRVGNYRTTGATLTITREAFTAGQTVVPGNPNYYHEGVFTTDSGADEEVYHFIRIKDVERYSGRTVALKFHGSVDASKDVALEVTQNFGVGGSTAVQVDVETISLTTTDDKKILFITFPSISGKTVGTLSYSEFKIWLSAGSDFNGNTNSLGNQSGTLNISEIEIYPSDKELLVRRKTADEALFLCLDYYRVYDRVYLDRYTDITTEKHTQVFFNDMVAPPDVTIGGSNNGTTTLNISAINYVRLANTTATANTRTYATDVELNSEI